MREILAVWSFTCILATVNALECFKCINQADNKGKCVTTTYTCEPNQDSCLSLIEWKIPPYWTKHGERMYRITKECSTGNDCRDLRNQLRTKCKRDWYNDWMCIECCTGDLCNYYVTMGSTVTKSSILTVFASVVVVVIWLLH